MTLEFKCFQAIQEYADAKEKFIKERSELESHLRQQSENHQEQVLELEKQVSFLLLQSHQLKPCFIDCTHYNRCQ
jgi:hypothetical protein